MPELLAPFLILALGVVLIAAEDLLPTGGVLGVFAAGCLLWFLYIGFAQSIDLGVRYLVVEVVSVPLFYLGSSFVFDRLGLRRLVSLQPPELHELDVRQEGPDLDRFVGLRGRAASALRPSGLVDFEGRRLEGLSEAGFIAPGADILAVRVRSGQLIVRLEESARRDPEEGLV